MKCNPDYHHRRSIRLPKYDYSQSGVYFVTICTYQKQCLFGDIKQEKMILNQIGKIVVQEWLKSSEIRSELQLHEWIIMPNHIHGIVVITSNYQDMKYHKDAINNEGASLAPLQRKPKSLSTFVWGFKSAVTKRIKSLCVDDNVRVWQKNYYESIVQDEKQLNNIRQYIIDNPQKWDDDPEKPSNPEIMIDFVF